MPHRPRNNVIQAVFIDNTQIVMGESVISQDDTRQLIERLNKKIETLTKKITNMKQEIEKKEFCSQKYKREVQGLKDKNKELTQTSEKYKSLSEKLIKENFESVNSLKKMNERTNVSYMNEFNMRQKWINEAFKMTAKSETLEKENDDLNRMIIDIKIKWAEEVETITQYMK
tara:strand:+ start:469 stop:984 length:516 start_codon:yes stop_codon:yes gene_type:complete